MMVTLCDATKEPEGRLLLEISRGDDNLLEGKRNHLLLSVLIIICFKLPAEFSSGLSIITDQEPH